MTPLRDSEPSSPAATYRAHGSFRLILALMVVLTHGTFLAVNFGPYLPQNALGGIAVMNFFVLSGFIIAEVVDIFYRGRPGAFLTNRALRLLPPYWAAVALALALHFALSYFQVLTIPKGGDLPADALSLRSLLVQITAVIPILNFNKVLAPQDWYYFVQFFWAILIEFVFYLSVTIAVAAWPLVRRFMEIKTFLTLCVFGAIAVHVFNNYGRHLHFYLDFVPYFTLGMALYALSTRRDRMAGLVAIVSYVLVAFQFVQYQFGKSVPELGWSGLAAPGVLGPLLFMLAGPLLILGLAAVRLPQQYVRWDQWIGNLSYPIYLNHGTVLIATWSIFHASGTGITIATLALTLVVGYIMKTLVETPMVPLRDRVRGHSLLRQSPPNSADTDPLVSAIIPPVSNPTRLAS